MRKILSGVVSGNWRRAAGRLRAVGRGPAVVFAALALVALLVALPLQTGGPSAAQTPSSVTFAVIGDYGSNDANESAVANLVKSWNPDFVVTVGDNNYPDGEAATIDANVGKYYHEFIHPYTGAYGAGAATNRFWPSVGNRDWENLSGARLQPYLDYFTLPGNERYYDFVQGPVHFFMLDSDSREPDGITSTSAQAQWLQGRLAASTATWKIVILHHPPFSSRTSWSNLQWPFREWGADAVLSGHAHIYERVLKNGFPYFVNGLGGESLGSFSTAIEGSMVRFGSDFGALRVTAGQAEITFQFITRAGVVVDTYSISRDASTPNAPTNLTATALSPSQIDLAWTDNSTNEDGFQVEQSTDGVNFTRVATVGPNINAYSNTGLQPATLYHYRVRAFASEQNSEYSNTARASTTMNPPSAPTALTATAVSAGQINLAWADNSTNEAGFEVERCAGSSCTNFSTVAETGANVTSYSNGGLAASSTYRYRVRAFNDSGDSAYSNIAQATTAAASSKPVAPSGLTATAVSAAQVNLSWADNSTNEDGFHVFRSTDGTKFTRAATVGPDVTTFEDTGRAASTTYYYRVQSYNAVGSSAYSNTASARTFAPATVRPAAPTGLVATVISASQIRLAWTDNSSNEDGFKLYRSTDSVNFTQVFKSGINVTGYTDSGLAGSTLYYYQVRAFNAAGNSSASNTASARTQ